MKKRERFITYGRRALQAEGTASAKSLWQEHTFHALRKAGRLVWLAGWRDRGRKMEEDVSDVVKDQVTEGLMEHGKSF